MPAPELEGENPSSSGLLSCLPVVCGRFDQLLKSSDALMRFHTIWKLLLISSLLPLQEMSTK